MKILAVDTSSIVASCALINENKLICEYTLNHKKTHSQKLMPIIKEILVASEILPNEIDVFAASIGPGSFTGLRIGIATINGLAHASNKPVVGVKTIDALAYNIPYFDGIIVPIMDARRNNVYTGIYKQEDNEFNILKEQTVMNIDKLIEILKERKEKIVFNGDGVITYKEKLIDELNVRAIFSPNNLNMPKASSVAEIAMIKAKSGETQSYYDLKPEYLRKSQAERQYDEKENNKQVVK